MVTKTENRKLGDDMSVGIVGYGKLGQYLAKKIQDGAGMSIGFIYNRTPDKIREDFKDDSVPILGKIEEVADYAKRVDLILEVAHPKVSEEQACVWLEHCHVCVGSPTCFAGPEFYEQVQKTCNVTGYSCFVPAGALWGGPDIRKMADLGICEKVSVTMKKAPGSLRLACPELQKLLESVKDTPGEHVIFDGDVSELAFKAPNNVNTMACAAIAAGSFEKTRAKLCVDKDLEFHIIDVEVQGPGGFVVNSTRKNPAGKQDVTGRLTLDSFYSSLALSKELSLSKPAGLHLC